MKKLRIRGVLVAAEQTYFHQTSGSADKEKVSLLVERTEAVLLG